MTIYQDWLRIDAKKDAKTKLEAYGIPYQSIRAKSISFEDPSRHIAVFVYVKGIDFRVDGTIAKWEKLRKSIPQPTKGGYILKVGC